MARRPNYGFEKRQKELQRQQKRDEKAERKRLKKEEGIAAEGTENEPETDEPDETGGDE